MQLDGHEGADPRLQPSPPSLCIGTRWCPLWSMWLWMSWALSPEEPLRPRGYGLLHQVARDVCGVRNPIRVLPPLLSAWSARCSAVLVHTRSCTATRRRTSRLACSMVSSGGWASERLGLLRCIPKSDGIEELFNCTLATQLVMTSQSPAARLGAASALGPVGILDSSLGVNKVHPCSPYFWT